MFEFQIKNLDENIENLRGSRSCSLGYHPDSGERFLLERSKNSDLHCNIWDACGPPIAVNVVAPSAKFPAPVSECRITESFTAIRLNQVSVNYVASNAIFEGHFDEEPLLHSDFIGR
jgi:hypothetical protein